MHLGPQPGLTAMLQFDQSWFFPLNDKTKEARVTRGQVRIAAISSGIGMLSRCLRCEWNEDRDEKVESSVQKRILPLGLENSVGLSRPFSLKAVDSNPVQGCACVRVCVRERQRESVLIESWKHETEVCVRDRRSSA